MRIYHLLAVTPAPHVPAEVPKVEYRTYLVRAQSADAAAKLILPMLEGKASMELWAAPMQTGPILVTPESVLVETQTLHQHLHWMSVQKNYEMVGLGGQTIVAFIANRTHKYLEDATAAVPF